jgi:hypothetical protein
MNDSKLKLFFVYFVFCIYLSRLYFCFDNVRFLSKFIEIEHTNWPKRHGVASGDNFWKQEKTARTLKIMYNVRTDWILINLIYSTPCCTCASSPRKVCRSLAFYGILCKEIVTPKVIAFIMCIHLWMVNIQQDEWFYYY